MMRKVLVIAVVLALWVALLFVNASARMPMKAGVKLGLNLAKMSGEATENTDTIVPRA